MYQRHKDFREYHPVKEEELDAIINSRVLHLEGLNEAIIIKRIELLHSHGVYIIRTTSADGLQGISITNTWMEYVYPILLKLIAPCFIGKDARDLESLLEKTYVYKNNYKLASISYYTCLSALEISILDLLAKAKKVSLGELFGPRIRESANMYVSSGNRHTTAKEELEVLKRDVEACGAHAIKFKIGGRMSHNQDAMEGRSEELIHLTRDYFGDDMIIHADGNGSYDVETAVRYGKLLEEINAYFYEEPCPFDDLESTKAVTDRTRIPLAFGEQEFSMPRFKWLILNHGCDVIQPDILYNGGFIRTTKVARMAQAANITVTPHASTGFCFTYILHFASYIPNMGKYLEMKEGLEMVNDFIGGLITLKDGTMNIPKTIGLGIKEDSMWMREAIVLGTVYE